MEHRKAFNQFLSERINEILEQIPSQKVKQEPDVLETLMKGFSITEREKMENLLDRIAEISAEEYRAVYLGGLLDGLYLRFLS